MKNIFCIILVVFFAPTVLAAQYMKGSFSFNSTTKELSFWIKPVNGNITSAIGYFEFDVRYAPTADLTFGVVTPNTTAFPGLTISTGPGPLYGGQNIQIFNFTNTILSQTYVQDTEYLVFKVVLSGSGTPQLDLITNYPSVLGYPAFAVNDGAGNPLFDPNLLDIFYPSQTSAGDDIFYSLSAPLPLLLTRFDLKTGPDYVDLHWHTEREINVEGYDVERSANGVDFTKIGYQQSLRSWTNNTYLFTDKAVETGRTYFYRLKMRDEDGTFTYSPILLAVFAGKQPFLYPNPLINSRLNVNWQDFKPDQIEIYDHAGRVVLSLFDVEEPPTQLDMNQLPAGSYTLKALASGSVQVALPFVKQ